MTHLLPLGLLVLLPSLAAAQATPPAAAKDQPQTVRLLLRPAAEPAAALKYQLLPPMMDRRPGNAAVQYEKAAILLSEGDRRKSMEKINNWLDMPLDKLARSEVSKELIGFKSVLDQVELAARREHCDWELPFGEQSFISMLLPELQKLRDFGRLLELQARLQIAEGKLDDALHTLQTGFALGRHAGQGQSLIHALVGIAICQLMSAPLQELIQRPEAPNLYWALTSLPRPLIDLRPALEAEMNMIYLSFPFLRNVDQQRNDLAYWQQLLDRTEEAIVHSLGVQPPELGWRPVATLLALKGYPAAKRILIDQGHSPKDVEEMPVPKAIILATLQSNDELRDRLFKWAFVPYSEAVRGMAEADHYLKTEGFSREVLPLARLLLPAVGSAFQAPARNDRRIAVLRTIEALRIYGASHQGRLPERLADVTEVPVPVDPTTGQPFFYRKTGEKAVLESPAPPGRQPRTDAIRLEIEFAK